MTQPVAIVTDSIACLTRELVERYQIEILPVNFYAGGRLYRDWIDVTPSEAYQLFLNDPESFRTSAPSPEDCLEALRNASRRAGNILCVTVSVKISTVFNAAREAMELAEAELPGSVVQVLDSKTAAAAEGFVALAAARAAAAGKNVAEVLAAAESIRDKVHCIVFLDTLRHVYRSGRVPKIAAQVGAKLNIRPIFTVHEEVHFTGAVRSRKHGIDRILEMMKDRVGQSPAHVAVMHAYAPDEAEKLKRRVSAEFNCVELWLSEFSPIMGYACGTGTVGVAFYSVDQAAGEIPPNAL